MASHHSSRAPVVHHHVAMMVCDDPAALEEVLVDLDLDALVHQRIGARAVVVPASELGVLRDALHARGVFPKVIGEPVSMGEQE